MGDSSVSPANLFKNTSTVNADGTVTPGCTWLMPGFTIIDAGSMETAQEITKACPLLDIGGSPEVSELMQWPA